MSADEDHYGEQAHLSAKPKEDVVNHPSHYTSGGIETIDYLKAKLTKEEFRGLCRGTALKYLSRAGKKDNNEELQEYAKARWYLNALISDIEERG